jgi:hypothetical protein
MKEPTFLLSYNLSKGNQGWFCPLFVFPHLSTEDELDNLGLNSIFIDEILSAMVPLQF